MSDELVSVIKTYTDMPGNVRRARVSDQDLQLAVHGVQDVHNLQHAAPRRPHDVLRSLRPGIPHLLRQFASYPVG